MIDTNNIVGAPSLDNQASTFLGQNVLSSACKAMLFVFTPKNLSDQFRRPHLYRFNYDFVNNVLNNIEDTARRGLNINLSSYMQNNATNLGAVIPSQTGIPINTNTMRELWTFILVIDNDKSNFSITPSGINTRTIYSGFCVDEPVGNGIMGRDMPVNENCVLIATHRTTVNVGTQFDNFGSRSIVHTMANADIVPSQFSMVTGPANSQLYNLSPEFINSAVSVNPDNTVNIFGAHSALQPNYNPQIGFEMNSPRNHMQKITSSLHEALLHSHPLAAEEDYASIIGGGQNLRLTMFENNLNTMPASIPTQIKCDEPFLLGEIVHKYPNLDVIDCRSAFANPWEASFQGSPNATNVGNAILSSSVPYVLSNLSLASIAFRYNSWMSENIVGATRGIDQCLHISSLVQMAAGQLHAKYRQFIDYLKQYVFPMISNINGEFDLMMNCSLMGPSLINLRFMDNTNQFGGFYESSNLFSGATSPLIGDASCLENNATEFSKLTKAILDLPPQFSPNIEGINTSFI